MDLRTKLFSWKIALIVSVVLTVKNPHFYKHFLQSNCAFIKCSKISLVVLFSNFGLVFSIKYHKDVEDFLRNVIMLLREGITGIKISWTEVIVCWRKQFIPFRGVLQRCNDSKHLNHLICIKISQG